MNIVEINNSIEKSKLNVLLFTSDMLGKQIASKLLNSPNIGNIYINKLYNNEFIEDEKITFISANSFNQYQKIVKQYDINLVVILNNLYTDCGLANFFKYNLKIPTVGITRYWMKLENSKKFGKQFMQQYNLPLTNYMVVSNLNELKTAISKFGYPIVIKDDRQQFGFGVFICNNEKDCIKQAKRMLKENKFCIVEQFISGKEYTLHHIWDGKSLKVLEPVRDFKRLENGDKGVNTGSMGSYVPVLLTQKEREQIIDYNSKLEKIFKEKRPTFTGIFVSDIMFSNSKLYNLEFNMRPGTPEFETLIENLDIDLLELFYNIAISNLDSMQIKYKNVISGSLNIVHKNYNKALTKRKNEKVKFSNEFINGTSDISVNYHCLESSEKDMIIETYNKIYTVISSDIENPFAKIYEYVSQLKDKNLYYRTDLGNLK